MTHYWWMHWFWITFWFYHQFIIVFSHTLLATLHSNSTIQLPTTKLNVSENSSQEIIPPKNLSPVVLRNITQYARNESTRMPRQFLRRLGAFPSNNVPIKINASDSNNTTIKDFVAVINNTFSDRLDTNFTDFNHNASSNNHTENITYLGEEFGFNHSFIQSERIGIEEPAENDDNLGNLSAAGITGITVGCIVIVGVICGASFFVYQYQGFNRPQVLNDRCSNPDSSGYIDDASDNSEEMYSLDNDSFLNSLEAMTIQNYWTDTVKHTKL
ncbi:uncharacterized protein LOC126748760 isoform X2 [Anthonomus grandis grandis]|uniref:uncharacterized protein LOC126748760 isoform X2 n=1 Tax=Anthonomus grandis grandis TaxID=2921223 RepID=UPI00216565E2|nr:uncharacterized protein LOC126748760 isoform X2 [Anthonomus grandis grandis]